MPTLDVSEILDDPEFVDTTLVRVRRSANIDRYGRLSGESERLPFDGVVTVDAQRAVEYTDAGTRVHSHIMIHTTTNLIAADTANDTPPDTIEWQARQYRVDALADYGTYGAGFVAARCSILGIA